jgi:hypothetical protein
VTEKIGFATASDIISLIPSPLVGEGEGEGELIFAGSALLGLF